MRPYERLPMPMPADFNPGQKFFYDNFIKFFIPDMIRMMDTGLDIDEKAVEKLRKTIDKVLISVEKRLKHSPLIQQYQTHRLPAAQKAYAEKCTEAIRDVDYYLKDFNEKDITHRTWIVNAFLTDDENKRDHKEKWTISDLKKYNKWRASAFINKIIDKKDIKKHPTVTKGMLELAKYKVELWNRPRYDKADKPVELAPFNPGSADQKREFFDMLKIKPLAFSKDTGAASWGREHLEELQKMHTYDKRLLRVLQPMIDHSYSAIIKNNFLKAFDSYTIDGVLHGNIRLFGAKSFRNTSNSPNLLNAPSTGSIYAKPLKKCIKAPKGSVIYTADLAALEDRVIANLSDDTNKKNIFLEGLDGHSLNACGYFPKLIEKAGMGKNTNNVEYVKEFYRRVDVDKNAILDGIRFKSKAPTFKLAYGGFPDADKGGVITQEIFDNYHNVLYPGITEYRERYVLPSTRRQGFIHLGLGCIMYSSHPDADIRTLNNATVQFWSILTLIAINEFNYRLTEEDLHEEVKVSSTIYDSIYVKTLADPEIIKWVNDNLIELMCVQYLEDEAIHNEASGDIGLNWAELHKISNNASLEEIKAVLEIMYGK